ncbi:magnesium transporter [Nocardiopsis flavescens]|uniref:Magnesium transporter n=1 Tax=Nocardiopsis flavescens TaxID=758803 RepID=A0A1M6V119_9ACTN|nr:magnesium and cobalt transport protein CorA [Nocardiopsis flavescens]SHK75192.1 magnesium transporter [Nocardiopsis flavescens]
MTTGATGPHEHFGSGLPAPERTLALGRDGAAVPADTPPGRMWIRLYREGRPDGSADTPARAREAVAAGGGRMAWIALTDPGRDQLKDLAHAFGLPPLALEDAVVAHQRPKAELYRDVLFTVLRPAGYDEEAEAVRVGEVHVFAGADFVVTIAHTEQLDLDALRGRLEDRPRLLARGPLAVLYSVLDHVVDAYAPTVAALQDDIDDVEGEVFAGARGSSRRTYRLAREVILLQRAVDPLGGVLEELMAPLRSPGEHRDGGPGPHGDAADRERLYGHLRDIADHQAAVRERVDALGQLLQNIMAVNGTLVGQAQNEAMKKVSSWGGILVVPTLIASVYGMNIPPSPGFGWTFSWPLTLALMGLSSLGLYLVFRRNGWL